MIDNMTIENCSYFQDKEGNILAVEATINGDAMSVPLDPANRHYAEIMRQVEAGTLTIAEASVE